VKQLFDQYSELLQRHSPAKRLVGAGTELSDLWRQSVEALSGLALGADFGGTIVDVGAGQGIVGVPALLEYPLARVCFVEPDRRKAAFLMDLKLSLGVPYSARIKVVCDRIERVSRETVAREGHGPTLLLARAFSSSISLLEALQASEFSSCPAYAFTTTAGGQKFIFEALKLAGNQQ
jgi:16S rRNA G527 N7-methylase RsmG